MAIPSIGHISAHNTLILALRFLGDREAELAGLDKGEDVDVEEIG